MTAAVQGAAQRRRTRPRRFGAQAPTTRCSASPRSTSSSAPHQPTTRPPPLCSISATSYVDQLAQLMDIKVVQGDHNQVTVFTNSGIQLVGIAASHALLRRAGLDDGDGAMERRSEPSAPSARIVLKGPNGGDVDLIANKSIRSGQIAAYLEMRDQVLVQAQSAARPDRRRPGERAVRSHRRRHGGASRRRNRASTSTSAGCRTAIRSASPIPTTRRARSTPSRWCASTIPPLCRCPIPRQPIRTTRSSASISPAACRSIVSQLNAALGDHAAAVLQSGRHDAAHPRRRRGQQGRRGCGLGDQDRRRR